MYSWLKKFGLVVHKAKEIVLVVVGKSLRIKETVMLSHMYSYSGMS